MEGDPPEFVVRLLWDVALGDIDLDRDAPLIFERVMTRGSWQAMQWLRTRYSRDALAAFLRREGPRRLSPRDLAYWALVCDVEIEAGAGGGRPAWADRPTGERVA